MRARLWAAGAAAWIVAFLVLAYVRFAPQPWYAAIVALAGLLALAAAIIGAGRGRVLLLFAMAILVIAGLLGGWTAGPVLLPAVIAAVLAVKASPTPAPRSDARK